MDIEALKRVSEVRRMLASGQARERRLSLRMSLREVSTALEMTPGSLSRWESGQVQPRAGAALKLADILGIRTADSREKAA
ncbi:helix-turn-helix domain-containing protein [Streptomyces sp. NBC_01092]|uniref:helix-turn-helix domain-containing protein n=1 Tax=Streptomyces sp. NBC_01092 TaxID=2903748 RepID=UPI0038703EE3|nr:helix-turn-helix domain-containing protein [Streptomyces sp. NBC_01092]